MVQPPGGMLTYLLFPLTIGPRLVRAYERGKPHDDFREMGDIMRRDFLTIWFFLYGFDPLNRIMMKVQQKVSGLKLMQGTGVHSEVLKYSELENYYSLNHANSWKNLVSILDDGYSKGMRKSLSQLFDGGLSKRGEPKLQKLIEQATGKFEDLMTAHQYHARFSKKAGVGHIPMEVAEKAKQAFRTIQNLETERARLAKPAMEALEAAKKTRKVGNCGSLYERSAPQAVVCYVSQSITSIH